MMNNAAFWQILSAIIIALLSAGWVTQWAKNRGDSGLKRQDEIASIRKDQREDIAKLEKKIEDQASKYEEKIATLQKEHEAEKTATATEIKRLEDELRKMRDELARDRLFKERILYMIEERLHDRDAWLKVAAEIRAMLQQDGVELPPSRLPIAIQPRVLIVDDSEDTTQMLSTMLRGQGFDTSCAYSGGDAVMQVEAAWQTHKPFDLVVVDYQMPGMNGEAVYRQIRDKESRIPGRVQMHVAFFTGNTDQVSDETKRAPRVTCLDKVNDVTRFPQRVREILST